MSEYSIPVGTLIQTCACGAKICVVRAEPDSKKDLDLVTVNYVRDRDVPAIHARGVLHVCAKTVLKSFQKVVEDRVLESARMVAAGELKATFCKGASCGKIIYFRVTEAGKTTPVNADGTPHWATCKDNATFRSGFLKGQSSTRLAADETPSLWNGENTSPGQQRESRKGSQ